MWLGKFLDIKTDIETMATEIKKQILNHIKKDKLTPLEFTILESVFNRKISGYDLMEKLNNHFSGQWEAQSGTIYPILSKLKRGGFLDSKEIKSPLGPLKKVYFLTEAGNHLIKYKVNKNFIEQLKFVENFLTELSSIYVHSLLNDGIKDDQTNAKIKEVQTLLKTMSDNVINNLPSSVIIKGFCPECNAKVDRDEAKFCAYCGSSFENEVKEKELDDFKTEQN